MKAVIYVEILASRLQGRNDGLAFSLLLVSKTWNCIGDVAAPCLLDLWPSMIMAAKSPALLSYLLFQALKYCISG